MKAKEIAIIFLDEKLTEQYIAPKGPIGVGLLQTRVGPMGQHLKKQKIDPDWRANQIRALMDPNQQADPIWVQPKLFLKISSF